LGFNKSIIASKKLKRRHQGEKSRFVADIVVILKSSKVQNFENEVKELNNSYSVSVLVSVCKKSINIFYKKKKG
jgi:hypothetical protein